MAAADPVSTGRWRDRIEELLDELRSSPEITVRHADVAGGATSAELVTARNYASYRLPEGVEDFYAEVNGFQLEWEHRRPLPPDQIPDRGSVNLLPVQRIFGSWKGVTWFDGFDGGDRYRAVKPFDLFGSEACAAFCHEDRSVPEDQVYFHYFGEVLAPTGQSFPSYLDHLFAARGYLYWQLALLADARGNPEVRRFADRMPALFRSFAPEKFAALVRPD